MEADLQALLAWRAGDTAAGDELVRRHFGAVYRFFTGKVPNEAKDLAQQTLMGCLEARTPIRDDGSFRSLLFAIARNVLLMHLRSTSNRARRIVPDQTSLHEIKGDNRTTPSAALARSAQRATLIEALRRLPIDFQIALELHYWEGLGVVEIGEVLEIPAGTVKSRLARGRAMLRTQLAELRTEAR